MNRNVVANLLPHLVVWGLLGLFVYAVIFRGPSYIVNIIVTFFGIPLIIFAAKIAPWWNKRIDEQRKSLASRLNISDRTARIILYGLPATFTNAWAFRIYGFVLTLLSVYHLYNQYLMGTFGQGIDNKSATGIMLNIFMAFCFVQMWLTRPYKKIVVGLGVSWFLMVISYILSMYANIEIFFLIGFLAFIGFLFFLVKMIKAYLKFKRGLS